MKKTFNVTRCEISLLQQFIKRTLNVYTLVNKFIAKLYQKNFKYK